MNPIDRQLSEAGVHLTPSLRAAVSLALVADAQERAALLQRFGFRSSDLTKILDVLSLELQEQAPPSPARDPRAV